MRRIMHYVQISSTKKAPQQLRGFLHLTKKAIRYATKPF